MDERYFAVGDRFTCVYDGEARRCEVTEIPRNRDYLQVRTADGYRNLKYYKIRDFKSISLAK